MSDILAKPGRVLLVNPPIVDLRMPWAEWIEPTALLKIGNLLRSHGNDVRLLDCFRSSPRHRKRDAIIIREEQHLNRWCFGLEGSQIKRRLQALRKEEWIPDHVFITTLTSFWWHGAALVSSLVRQVFPDAAITLGGAYPEDAYQHAEQFGGADHVGDELAAEAIQWPSALDLYEDGISTVALSDIDGIGFDAVFSTIDVALAQGATRIHLADHGIASKAPDLLKAILEHLAHAYTRSRVRLFVLGEISAQEIVAWPELPNLLRAARCRQLVLADHRDYTIGQAGDDSFVADVQEATEAVVAAGFRWGTDDYAVEMSVGRLGDSPEDSARLLAHLSHAAGSVIPVPFQPSLSAVGVEDPWETNGKLFPLAARNNASFMSYMELLGLCAIANAKYRTHTFDFMKEDSLIARSLRRALVNRSWDPHDGVAVMELPVVQVKGA